MAIYILNSPILTEYGKYDFQKITTEEAQKLLSNGNFISAVGHQATAEVMSSLLGVKIPTQRIQVKMQPKDKAIIFRLLTRLEEGKVLSREELEALPFEIGLLDFLE